MAKTRVYSSATATRYRQSERWASVHQTRSIAHRAVCRGDVFKLFCAGAFDGAVRAHGYVSMQTTNHRTAAVCKP